jgi:hypothetical protein
MRKTVDEKLHATLESRLTASFQQVSERLERVHQGLGEMQQLALGVGDLKRVLTNVKTRGTWGEVQLEMLLEQVLTPDQYAKNVETIAGSGARVEFALKLPGQSDGGAPVDADRRQVPERAVRTPAEAPMPKAWRGRARAGTRRAHGSKPSPRNTSRRRTPPTSPSCSCPPKACMRK